MLFHKVHIVKRRVGLWRNDGHSFSTHALYSDIMYVAATEDIPNATHAFPNNKERIGTKIPEA